jgi:hypothetical protein
LFLVIHIRGTKLGAEKNKAERERGGGKSEQEEELLLSLSI